MDVGKMEWDIIITSSCVDHRVPVTAFNGGLKCTNSVQRSLFSPTRWVGQVRIGCDGPSQRLIAQRLNEWRDELMTFPE